MFDYLVFIGRFQPFHLGHRFVIEQALAQSKQVIVLIGSARVPRSTRNPFTLQERTQMILGAFAPDQAQRIHCVALDDILYNDTRWVHQVQQGVLSVTGAASGQKVGLIGHNKDSSSYYLSLFPHWPAVNVPNFNNLSATPVRDGYLLGATPLTDFVPASTLAVLNQLSQTDSYQKLQEEAWFIDRYKRQWELSPYPPTFVTVDAVVIQSGHILLVERQAMPGQGLYALPGGFIGERETLFDACVRELREETRLKVPDPVIRGSLKAQKTYDDPYRSARGRTITQAFYFALKNDPAGLPKVKGGDDARRAFWVALADVQPEQMFEDHFAIITDLTGL